MDPSPDGDFLVDDFFSVGQEFGLDDEILDHSPVKELAEEVST